MHQMTWLNFALRIALVAGFPVAAGAAVTLGSNSIVNSGGENGSANWTAVSPNSLFSVQKYEATGYPKTTDPGPANRGTYFFFGGGNAVAEGHQVVNMANIAGTINGVGVNYSASAFLGGFLTQNDVATVTIRFQNSGGVTLATANLPGPNASQRSNTTGLFQVSAAGRVPVGTVKADVDIQMTRASGASNDGYADALSLIFTSALGLNTNVILNGDAEANLTGWTAVGTNASIATQVYGATSFPAATDPGPINRGARFFYGGANAGAESHQAIDITNLSSYIGAGLRYTLDGYLGGWATQDDRAWVNLYFLAADGSTIEIVTLGGPYSAERLTTTGLFESKMDGIVPAGTVTADVHIGVYRAGGSAADGYLDSLTLVFHQ
jgi:hypothetical protein